MSAAAVLALRSPLSVLLDVQAERPPLSKPSAKIRSEDEVGVGVKVFVFVAVGPPGVLVCDIVPVGEGVAVAVAVGVKVEVGPPGV